MFAVEQNMPGYRMRLLTRLAFFLFAFFTAIYCNAGSYIAPTNLTNSALSGGNASNSLLQIYTTGFETNVTYVITTNVPVDWLIVSNGVGIITNAEIRPIWLTFDITGLSGGIRTGILDAALSNMDGSMNTQIVTLVLNLIDFSAGPGLTNRVLRGFNATNQTFGVAAGGGRMTYTVTANDGGLGWLSVNPSNGYVIGTTTNMITNIYTTASLAAGNYQGVVSVATSDGGGATNEVGVTLTVYSTPVLTGNPSPVRQIVDKGANPTNDSFYVWNNSAAPVVGIEYWAAVTNDDSNILQGITPTEGINTGEQDAITISYKNVSSYESGIYTAAVALAATNYGSGYNGNWSGATNIPIILVIATPDSPDQVCASKGTYENKVSINWSPSATPSGGPVTYNLLRHTTFDINYAQTIVSGLTITNYNDVSVLPGVRYYYWVKCVNSYGYAGTGGVYDTGYRRLSAPGGLFASDGTYTNKIAVSWAEVDGASGYYVYRGSGGSTGIVYYTDGTEFEDNQVSEGVEYVYSVQATNSICGSVLSEGETGYVLWRPYGIIASDGLYVDKVALIWEAVNGATAYEVWRSLQTLTPPAGGGTKIAEIASTSYDDTSVTAGTKYYYWLKSKNSIVVSAYSAREEGFPATAAVDLSVWGLVVQPRRISPGGNAKTISFRLGNNGGAALSGDNGTVQLTFYSSANSVFGDNDDTLIGAVDQRVTMGIGESGIIRVVPAVVTMPSAEGSYYIFMKLIPAWPSTLAPSSSSGWTTRTANMIEVSSLGTINYQAMNDYDGDGISDLTVHGSSLWSARTVDGYELARNAVFGGSGVAVMGDYDGDRKTDPVVYDESRGYWQAFLSNSGYALAVGWFGGPGYRAVPGDYDGDGKTEAAVYDTVNSLWYALKIGDGRVMWALLFGYAGYEPVIGDYDGDGVWDLAVYGETTGLWYIRSLSGTLIISGDYWGGQGFKPVSGDYDGDGVWDLAVYDTASGRWYIKTVYGEIIAAGILWGASGYGPVSGDFNGDGLADLAVYNSNSGKWFIRTLGGSWLLLDATWGGGGNQAVGEVE